MLPTYTPTPTTGSTKTTLKATATATSSAGTTASSNSILKNLQTTTKQPASSPFSFANLFSSFNSNTVIPSLGKFTALIGTTALNPISIIPAGIAALTSTTGYFAQATQAINEYRQQFQSNVWSGVSGSGEKVPNPLRDHNHYNYVITLGVLSKAQNNAPDSYKNRDFDRVILRSGGGDYDKRQRAYSEGNADAEYFIENLEIDSVVAPNANTGVSLGTSLSFDVIEPLSMGHFTEALINAARDAGYSNFTDAPYCIKIEFYGWDAYGSSVGAYAAYPYYIPVKIIDVAFSVSNSGSIYNVKAVPHSEIALSDEVNVIHTETKSTGRTVHEVLETGGRSITNIMNIRAEGHETTKAIPEYDRYIVVFPKTPTAIADALRSKISNFKILSASEQMSILKGTTGVAEISNPKTRTALLEMSANNAKSEIYNILKTFAQDTTQMNDIGLSKFIDESTQGGNQSSNLATTYAETNMLFSRMIAEAQPSEFSAPFLFDQSYKFTDIIDNVVLSSKYAKDESSKADDSEQIRWYRLETYTFTEENAEVENKIGRPPRVYVYAIHPFIADQYHFLSPTGTPTTTEQLKKAAVKEYNYFYTGKNEDILELDIKFNYSFLQSAFSDFGQLTAVERTKGPADAVVQKASQPAAPPDASSTAQANSSGAATQFKPNNGSNTAGGSIATQDSARQLAVMYHDRLINSQADMIMVEMKIWGDPYYLPTVLGNDSPKESTVSRMMTAEGTMNYLRNEVMIVVNFLTPLDYDVGGSMVTFPEVNPKFSGVYQVISSTNSFDRGQFLQTLKLVRQRGQENTTTNNSKFITVNASSSTLAKPKPQPSRSGAVPATGVPVKPAAVISDVGTAIDSRVGIWANSAAGTIINPISSLSSLGNLLASAPSSLTSAISAGTTALNSVLTPTKPPTDSGRR